MTLSNQRALFYGESLFETMYFPDKSISISKHPFIDAHLARLQKGCQLLNFYFDKSKILLAIEHCYNHSDLKDSFVIRLLVTRDQSERGYGATTSKVLLQAQAFATSFEWAGKAHLWQHKLSSQPLLAGIKHGNRLEQVMAANELADGFDEIIMCDQNENIIEGSKCNLFFKIEGQWLTPDLIQCGVAGVVRATLLDNFPEIKVTNIHKSQLALVESIFACNSVLGIQGISQIGNLCYDVQSIQSFREWYDKLWLLSA